MRSLLVAIFILVGGVIPASAAVRGLIVLVPGTGNSLAPGAIQKHPISKELKSNPYFSKSILQELQGRGYDVFVVKHLSPAGKFEPNGEKSLELLTAYYKKAYPKGDVPIALVGHSAGGFYSLYMAHLNRRLPIQDIVLLSAGLHGLNLAQALFPWDDEKQTITIPGLDFYLDVRGLPQFKAENVKKFLSKLKLPPELKIYAIGGSQPPSSNLGDAPKAQYLSPVLKFTAGLIGEECDGIVESRSAYAQGVSIATTNGGTITARALPELHIRLEHPEQTLDHRIFKILGTKDSEYVDRSQRVLFNAIVDELEK